MEIIKDRRFWIAAAVVLVLNVAILAGWQLVGGSGSGLRVGVVDKSAVAAELRRHYMEVLLKQKSATSDVKDADKQAEAYIERANAIIDREIDAIGRECNCLLLVRGVAVGGADMRDYTDRVVQAIGSAS